MTRGNITINGGKVTAYCSNAGAAIGGGMRGKCGTIRISGGNITANAGLAAAAIGNGNMLGGSDSEKLIAAETGKIYYKLTYGSEAGHEDIFG